jgi:aspartyl-tRNA(Asn)/glutamyl-tRNA(Gln) amidotransferase subunit B
MSSQKIAEKPKSKNLVSGATGDWEIVIGMEVHAQVASKSKLFSGASTGFGAEPNSHVSLVDAAMPGMLPVINRECVAQAIRTGLGLKAEIKLKSVFDRKNYFYPDLPQGYQISQYKQPVVGEGEVEIEVDGEALKIGVERLHLEQDAGKSLHDQHPDYSYVDLNRSGVALMEIVSKPDLRSSKQAQAYITKMRSILRYLGTCDGDMEKGNLRADVNVSVRRPGDKLGTRCEIKNVNSIRFIGQAIEYEARRQIDMIEGGGTIDQETRLFDAAKGETRSMRSKEEAHDYRYFPDPDLLPLELTQSYVDDLASALPELPDEKRARFMKSFGLSGYDADVLVAERSSADYFETVAKGRDGKVAANWVINELFGRLNKEGKTIEESPVSAAQLGGIVDLIASNAISGKIAKDLFEIVWTEGGEPAEIVEKRGMKQVTDTETIDKAIEEIIAANPDKMRQLNIKPTLLGWFVGQVMKSTQGRANPSAVNELLRSRLDFSSEVIPTANFSIFESAAVQSFRTQWQKKSGNAQISEWTDEQLLANAELTQDGRPTFASLVLLGTSDAISRYLANAEVIFEFRHSDSSIPFQQRVELRSGFFSWVDEIWELINLRNESQSFRVGMFRYEIPTFDEDSVREAVLNAVAHRDYRIEGSVWIKQTPRLLEVESPGGLPEGITADNMLVRQKPRNRRIAEALAKCGLVERSGQGMDRMFRQSILQGKPLPDLSQSDAHRVVVRLSGEVGDTRFLRFLEQVGDAQLRSFTTDDILVIDLIHREQEVPQQLETRIPHLIDAGVIERVGKKKILSRKFYEFLGEKGVHTRKKGLDRETEKELLLQHIRNSQEGAPLKELLQVLPSRTRDQVRGLLDELRRENRVHPKGERRGARWCFGGKSDLGSAE